MAKPEAPRIRTAGIHSPVTPTNTTFASSSTSPGPPQEKYGSLHRRTASRGSYASPIEILSKSPTARRMSQSMTPQSGPGTVIPDPMGLLTRLRDSNQFRMACVLSSVVLLGALYSLVFSTSTDTSLSQPSLTPESPDSPYLSRKSNILNQLFVKLSWFWTSLLFMIHLISSPPSGSNSRSTLATAYLISSGCWYLFTNWFFGPGLGDRMIKYSGGSCSITIPGEWGVDPASLTHLYPASLVSQAAKSVLFNGEELEISTGHTHEQVAPGSPFILPLHPSYCASRIALTPNTHPGLFDVLRRVMSPTTLSRTRMPRPRWHRGFDISGHIFILTISALFLTRLVTPSIKRWRTSKSSSAGLGRSGALHKISTVLVTGLIGLWLFMLATTSMYFHNPSEKLSGLALGLAVSALVNVLTPGKPSHLLQSPEIPVNRKAMLGSIAEDENAARRGQVVDDGAIMENEEEENGQRTDHDKSE